MAPPKDHFAISVQDRPEGHLVVILDPRTRPMTSTLRLVPLTEQPSTLILFLDAVTTILSQIDNLHDITVTCEGVGAEEFVSSATGIPGLPEICLHGEVMMNRIAYWVNRNWMRARDARHFRMEERFTKAVKPQDRIYEIHVDASAVLESHDNDSGPGPDGNYSYGVVCVMGGQKKVTCFSRTEKLEDSWLEKPEEISNHFEFDAAIRALDSMYQNFRSLRNPGDRMMVRLYCDNRSTVRLFRQLRKMNPENRRGAINEYLGTDHGADSILSVFAQRNVVFEAVEWEKGHADNVLNDYADWLARAERYRNAGTTSEADYMKLLNDYKDRARAYVMEHDPDLMTTRVYREVRARQVRTPVAA